MADTHEAADEIVSDAISELELEQYTKREIVEKLREFADDLEGDINNQSSSMMDNDVWIRGEK